MPLLHDLALVRAHLDRDRVWAAYAIGDLAPGYVEHCEWHAAAGQSPSALILMYRGFEPPILFAMGQAAELRPLFEEIRDQEISLHVRPEAIGAMAGIYRPTETRIMRRMSLDPDAFTAAHDDPRHTGKEVTVLGHRDVEAVAMLYEDGHRRGEGPTFFSPSMLQQNTFRGIWEDGALVAIAGTHLYSAELGVCAIGNVYTRSDRRGRGLAARVTSAVVAHAISDRVSTIVLNVGEHNLAAQRVYERLGFNTYGEFLEGEARREPNV